MSLAVTTFDTNTVLYIIKIAIKTFTLISISFTDKTN